MFKKVNSEFKKSNRNTYYTIIPNTYMPYDIYIYVVDMRSAAAAEQSRAESQAYKLIRNFDNGTVPMNSHRFWMIIPSFVYNPFVDSSIAF